MMVNIGFGNIVSSDRIIAMVDPESAPIKRLVIEAKQNGKLIDATCGRKTRAPGFKSDALVILVISA